MVRRRKAANDNIDWTLDVETHSREQLIDVASFLARAMRPDFFHDPHNIPYIIVPGDGGGGKCMIVEAMMKTLLDQYDSEDMKREGAPKGMFIERRSAEACQRYCSAFGSTDGVPVMLGFDRSTDRSDRGSQRRLEESFRGAAEFQKSDGPWPVGAIFASGVSIGDSKPWIVIHLEFDSGGWNRKLQIEVRENRLKSDPQFREYWKQLHAFKTTGELVEPSLYKSQEYKPGARKDFGYLLYRLGLQGDALETSLEGALLATIFENRKLLGVSEQEIIETVKSARNADSQPEQVSFFPNGRPVHRL